MASGADAGPTARTAWPPLSFAALEELHPAAPAIAVLASIAIAVLIFFRFVYHPYVPCVVVALTDAEEKAMRGEGGDAASSGSATANQIPCKDPSTGALLGVMNAASPEDVVKAVAKARAAQQEWKTSTFAQRRHLMRIISRCVLEHAEDICRVSACDSGKTMVDAGFGEVLVTLEKLHWLGSEGEKWLRPEKRSPGRVCFYKSARVEFHPRGVIGAIVPWNYPFHNVLNPLTAALFAGNAAVIKVSEHACWSSSYYGRLIRACLEAAGAPTDLVQIVPGYAAAGAALVSNVDKVIFVGSAKVGKLVMETAAKSLTPVTLELGGKDPLIVLPGTDLATTIPTVMRAGFGAAGQNCMGAERFFVHATLVDEFCKAVTSVANSMRQGPPLGGSVDIGAMCMPGEAQRIHALVTDAVARGAKLLAGGVLPSKSSSSSDSRGGQFYPPTVILIPDGLQIESRNMKLMQDEVFGPVITIIPFESDEQLITLVNDCDFALGSNIYGDPKHIAKLGKHVQAGMLACNDFATCYMCQSLPMGGLKDSGFGKFAGIEGLRALCVTKAVVEDRVSFMKTVVPPPLRYPLSDSAFPFILGLMGFFYGPSLGAKANGIWLLIKSAMPQNTKPKRS